MAPRILEQLAAGRILVSDGGLGTQLQARGLAPGQSPEGLNLARPEMVREVHAAYYAAGADMVATNTFGGTRPRLKGHGLEEQVVEVNRRGAQLAREACPEGRFVAGSMGPLGEMLEPYGTITADQAAEWFGEQVEALAAGGVDLILIETMQTLDEALLALRAARELTGLPVAVTMTFEHKPAGFRTMWGVSVEKAVAGLVEAGADALGSNCGCGFKDMLEIVRLMRPLTDKPIIAQSNAGLPEIVDGRTIYRETPDSVAPVIQQMIDAGANIIGGCCGTSPEHIALIRQLVEAAPAR